MTTPPPTTPSTPSPPDEDPRERGRFGYGSMSLLQQLMDRPLDPSYAAAADRREAAGLRRSTSTRGPVVIVSALLVGFLLVAAALALRPSGTTASRDKQQLIEQIQSRQARGDELAAQVSGLSSEIQGAQAAALASQASQLSAELDRLEVLTGEVAVAGPGLVLTVDDAPDARANSAAGDPRDANGFPKGRVTSFDLQILCNGLWQAGAEAISINGQRLTARSAIRFAGDAILVDYRPLSPPYAVTAVGDGRDLQTRFASTSSGPYLKSLGDNYAIPSTITTQAQVVVPRSSSVALAYAQPVPTGAPSASSTSGIPSGSTTSTRSTPSTKGPTS